ncbi:aldolase [Paenibacillus sp. HB172176]|uniref:aldolase n=1 Tax=Paenibacillus sp. HB172176 TaxID=2493690 RepID=UPI001438B933|nr:aldolase [Paenibacillus sp. HB172176]
MHIRNQSYLYRSFGLCIESDMPLPELPLLDLHREEALTSPVTVQEMDLSAFWLEASPVQSHIAMHKDMLLLHIPKTGLFGMQAGERIYYSPNGATELDKIRLYILGTCMAVVLMQRKILPLHGSALEIDGACYAIVGDSGAGKSTLSSFLLRQGHSLLSDDLIAVAVNAHGVPQVMPAYPQQKIWQETLDMLGRSSAGLSPLFDRETKFAVGVQEQFCHQPLPLAGVFELVKSEENAAIMPVVGLDRLQLLLQHTFRGFLLRPLGLLDWHFRMLTSFVNQIELYRLQRPAKGSTVQQLTEFVTEAAGLKKLEDLCVLEP